jgi:hypothetical protein
VVGILRRVQDGGGYLIDIPLGFWISVAAEFLNCWDATEIIPWREEQRPKGGTVSAQSHRNSVLLIGRYPL